MARSRVKKIAVHCPARKLEGKLLAVLRTTDNSTCEFGCVPILALKQAAEPAFGPPLCWIRQFQSVKWIPEMEYLAVPLFRQEPHIRDPHFGSQKPSCHVIADSPFSQPNFLDR